MKEIEQAYVSCRDWGNCTEWRYLKKQGITPEEKAQLHKFLTRAYSD